MTHRPARVGELIRQELSPILAREHSFGDMFVTIHHAEVAPDLRDCTVHIGIIGGKEENHAAVIERLNRAAGAIQRSLYKRVVLKHSPRLYFKIDRSAERGVRLVNAIELLPQAAQNSDEPMGDFKGKDGLDHRWEKAMESPAPTPFAPRKSATAFNTPLDNDEAEDDGELGDDEGADDDDSRE